VQKHDPDCSFSALVRTAWCPGKLDYRVTSRIRTPPPVGTYSSIMHRDLWWSLGGPPFYERGSPQLVGGHKGGGRFLMRCMGGFLMMLYVNIRTVFAAARPKSGLDGLKRAIFTATRPKYGLDCLVRVIFTAARPKSGLDCLIHAISIRHRPAPQHSPASSGSPSAKRLRLFALSGNA
jgi:hypothetical protein